MVWTIIKREILEHLKSSKFQVGFLITVVLLVISTTISIRDFEQRNQDYLAAREESKGSSYYVPVYRAPQVLSILVQGKDRKLGNKAIITYQMIPAKTSGYMGYGSQHYRFLAGFEAVDFVFVVRIVLSLMVIFLAYSTISGEKANGTLRLVLSNRIPRDQVLLGKCIGGMIIVISSFITAAFLSLVIMLCHPSVSLSDSDLIRIFGMLSASILYITVFYTLGLFVSTVVNRPAIALMVLLQVWVFVIVIYPVLGVIITENIYKLPDEYKLNQQKATAFQPYESEFKRKTEAFQNAFAGGRRPTAEQSVQNIEAQALQAEVYYQVDKEYMNRQAHQARLAQYISFISPAVLYDYVMLRYARTGMAEYSDFLDGIVMLWKEHVERSKLLYTDRDTWKKSKLPDFSYIHETATQSFFATVPQLLMLFFLCVIFFMSAFTAFLRKDVR